MKKTILAVSAAFFVAIPFAKALDDVDLPKGGSFYDGKTLQPQYDSTTDTVSTAYTPRYIGDFLVGQIDGSNSLWLSTGLTTDTWSLVTSSGGPFSADDISDDAVTEAKLKAVDSATDEDVLTYEETTGDFEWHSVAQIQAKFTEGSYADSTIVSADIKDDTIASADIGVIHQVDAADVTTNTLYTPGFVGQVLIGFVGPGTNSVWISKGATTNDWVLVAP